MTWSERIKLAWTTFKREALPLYTWTFIFIGIGITLAAAVVIVILNQWHWSLPQTYGDFPYPEMPVPGVPPKQGITPFTSPFHSFNGSLGGMYSLLTALGTITGTLGFFVIAIWLLGSAFYIGIFNLTVKSYHEKAEFKDFRLTGFFRFLGWQAFLLLIQSVLLIVGIIGASALRSSRGTLIVFLIVYSLIAAGIVIFTLPWLSSSAIYLLAHPKDRFRSALVGSWKFFCKHMGDLWGCIATIFLLEIAFQALNRISSAIAGLAALVLSPFIVVLAIVWVLSLEDEHNETTIPSEPEIAPPYPIVPYPEVQTNTINPPTYDLPTATQTPEVPVSETESSKANSQKEKEDRTAVSLQQESAIPLPNDNPNFCPSCGRANTGTAYCPQCGTKL